MVDQAERLRELIKNNNESKSPRVIAVTSGKGGVGKTNLSVNLAISLIELGAKVLLVDADLGMANVDIILGIVPKFNLDQVLAGEKKIEDVIVTGPMGLRIIPSGSGDYNMANLSDNTLEFCLKQLNDIEKSTDIMLIDTGAGISKSVLKFVLAADEVIIVTTPEPTAITDAYGIIKVLAGANPNTLIRVVVNMARDEREGKEVMERLAMVSRRFLDIELNNTGFILLDPNVSRSVKEQQPFVISRPRTLASQNIYEIARILLDKTGPRKASGSFFERLFGGIFR